MAVTKANCVFLFFPTAHGVDMEIPVNSLGANYLAALLLRDGHDCTSISAAPNVGGDDIVNRAAALSPDFVGLSLLSHDLERARVIGQALRDKLGPDVHISAGGYVPTFAGEWLLEHPGWHFLDSIVRGEAENIIGSLIAAIKNRKPVYEIDGVATREHPKSPTSFAPPPDDLDGLPWPERDPSDVSSTWLMSSRGCTELCTFCSGPHAKNLIGASKVCRYRSPESVVDEIEFLASRGMDTFRMSDPTYEDPGQVGKQRIKRIAELILERGLRIFYHIHARTHGWTEKDNDLIQILYKSGLERVSFGIESGSDRVLELFKKRARVEDHRRAINLFHRNNIDVHIGVLMFHPYALWSDLEKTADFLNSVGIGYDLFYLFNWLSVYPGTEIERQLSEDKLLEPAYMENLTPHAYRYIEPNIGRLAHTVMHLMHHCSSIIDFQIRDKVLSIYMKRLRRLLGEETVIREAINEAERIANREKEVLANFNQNLFKDLMSYARREEDVPMSMALNIEQQYGKASQQLNSAQMRLSMHMADKEEYLQMNEEWWYRAVGARGFAKKQLEHPVGMKW